MKVIASITDKDILGTDGMSSAAPRRTARAVVKNSEELYAVMYAEKFGLYSLPGGGMEGGESAEDALRREIMEETGCVCQTIAEIGCVLENRFHCDYTQESYYYFVTVGTACAPAGLTEAEISNGTGVQWHSLEEMQRLICEPEHTTTQRKFLQARDRAALFEYRRLISQTAAHDRDD